MNDLKAENRKKEWAEAQAAEYRAAGVTMKRKAIPTEASLSNIFFGHPAHSSFYTLEYEPKKGQLSIKIVVNNNNKITGVAI